MAHPVYVLTVNGAIVPSLRIGFDIREVANGRNRMTLAIYSKTGAPLIQLFDAVELTEDGVVIFGGSVDAPTEAGAGGQPITPTITTVSVVDQNQLAERRICFLDFPEGTLLSQLQLLMTVFGGTSPVTLDPAQPVGPIVPAWSAHYWRIDDVLNQLTTLSGGYLWNITYTRVLSMRLAASTLAPVMVTDANRVAVGDLTVTPSAESYANRVHLLYGDGAHEITQRWTGDGTTAVFTLSNHLVGHVGYVSNNGVNEPVGVTAPPYWTVNTTPPMTLTRSSPPAPGAPIAFTYTALFPGHVIADAPGGILTPPGFWEVAITVPDVFDVVVAQRMADDEVALRSARPRTIQYRTLEKGIHPGQSQTITKTARHLANVPTTISEVTIRNATGGPTERIVTAVEGGRFPGTWRDMIKGWNDAGSIAPVTAGSGGGGGGGGGGTPIGPGTPGYLAIWTGPASIGDSIVSQSGGALTVAGGVTATTLTGNGAALTNLNAGALATGTVPVPRLPQFVGGDVTTAAAGSVNLQLGAGVVGPGELAPGAVTGAAIADGAITSAKIADGTIQAIDLADGSVTNPKLAAGAVTTDKIADGTITNADISATAAIAWTKIDKTGAILDDIGGTLPWAKLPTGAGTWVGTPTISGSLTVSAHLYGIAPYSQDVGQLSKKFRAIHAAELWVETLVAQATTATIGGRILVGPSNILARDVAATTGDSVIYLKYRTPLLLVGGVETGSKLLFESGGRFEIMTVVDTVAPAADPTDGSFPYNVIRAQAGTASVWYAGESVFDTGKAGSGFIDLYSLAGVATPSAIGPTIVGNVRLPGGAATNWAPRWAVGNLRGLYHYSADVYGFGAGDKDASNLVIDAANGVRIRSAAVVYAQLAAGLFTLGLPTGNRLQWNGTDLVLVSKYLTIDAAGVRIAPAGDAYGYNDRAYRFDVDLAQWKLGLYGLSTSTAGWQELHLLNHYVGEYRSTGPGVTTTIEANWLPIAFPAKRSMLLLAAGPSGGSTADLYSDVITFRNSAGAAFLYAAPGLFETSSGGRFKGWGHSGATGLAVEVGIDAGAGKILCYDRTAGTSANLTLTAGAAGLLLRTDGYLFMTGSTRQPVGHYLYPGDISGSLGANQGTYFLASHASYGLYTNNGFYVGAGYLRTEQSLLQAINAGVYPGDVSGYLGNFQTAYYLGSHNVYGLYTNSGLFCEGLIRTVTEIATPRVRDGAYSANTKIEFDSSLRVVLSSGNGAATVLWDGAQFFPGTDNARALGYSANRWSIVYAVNGTINTSDARHKRDVTPTAFRSAFLASLDPIDYAWIDPAPGMTGRYCGLVAQDVARVAPDFGGLSRDADGVASGLNYGHFIAPLIAGWQEHDARIAALERKIDHAE